MAENRMNGLPNIACADNGAKHPINEVRQGFVNTDSDQAFKNELMLEIKKEIEKNMEKKFQAKEKSWAKKEEKLTKQIDDMRDELIELKTGTKTAILETRDNWRSHEDENWLLPRITEHYKEMKEKHKNDKKVLEELDKMYEIARSKRKLRATVVGLGVLALVAGGCWIYIEHDKRKVTEEEQGKE